MSLFVCLVANYTGATTAFPAILRPESGDDIQLLNVIMKEVERCIVLEIKAKFGSYI